MTSLLDALNIRININIKPVCRGWWHPMLKKINTLSLSTPDLGNETTTPPNSSPMCRRTSPRFATKCRWCLASTVIVSSITLSWKRRKNVNEWLKSQRSAFWKCSQSHGTVVQTSAEKRTLDWPKNGSWKFNKYLILKMSKSILCSSTPTSVSNDESS